MLCMALADAVTRLENALAQLRQPPPPPQPEPGGIPAAEAADLEARTVALAERVEAFNAQQAQ
jgi:hypothetical protein